MRESVTLHGYRFSVYHRIARLALHEKGVEYACIEVNPFADDIPGSYLALHPFGRVPALCHGAFSVFETTAITRYVDAAFSGPPLTPTSAKAQARMAQVIAIIDNYGYWPIVRQVFSHRVFRPLEGAPSDEGEIRKGLVGAHKTLAALESIATEGHVLDGKTLTLADCHLAPVIDYFTRAEEGRGALAAYPVLSRWWQCVSVAQSVSETDPGLPGA